MEPLIGILEANLTKRQEATLLLINSNPGSIVQVREKLFEKHRLGISTNKVLRQPARKRLVSHRRNLVEKTLPGTLLYEMMKFEEGTPLRRGEPGSRVWTGCPLPVDAIPTLQCAYPHHYKEERPRDAGSAGRDCVCNVVSV